jgi:AraC-like DNA-binding protein
MRLEQSARTLPKPVLFSTDEVDQTEKVSYWEQRFGSVWGAIKVGQDRSDFLGRIETSDFGDLRFNRISLCGLHFRRSSSTAGATQFFALGFPQKGLAVIERSRRESVFSSGTIYLIRHGEPDETRVHEGFETVNVQIPIHLLKHRVAELPDLSKWNATDSGMPILVRHFVWDLFEQTSSLSSSDRRLLSKQLCDLVSLLLTDHRAASSSDTSVLRAHRSRALRYMEQNLDDPSLGPERIADAIGLSLSYLNKIFAALDLTVMEELRRIRLARAQRMLHSAQFMHCSISEIAFRNGFKSLPDFSRVFRQAFDQSPTQYRGRGDR